MKTIFAIASLLLLNSPFDLQAQDFDFQTPNAEVARLVKERLLYGRTTLKWLGKPTLDVICESPEVKAFVERSFASMCQAAGLTTPGEGTFHVFIGRHKDFQKLGIAKRGVAFRPDRWYYWTNSEGSLSETLITENIELYQMYESSKSGNLFLNMLRLFGVFGGDDKGASRGVEFSTKLSPFDRLLFNFNYQHVPVGSMGGDLPKLLRQNWNK